MNGSGHEDKNHVETLCLFSALSNKKRRGCTQATTATTPPPPTPPPKKREIIKSTKKTPQPDSSKAIKTGGSFRWVGGLKAHEFWPHPT